MTSASAVPAPRSAAERVPDTAEIPALRSGDRLARSEFERRYALRPDLEKAELIEGIVRMPSPVSMAHSGPHAMIQGVLLVYSAFTPGVRCEDNATVRLDPDNEPQPDVLLRIEPDAGGQSRVSGDDYVEGRRSWRSRSPRAARPSICTTSCAPIDATAFGNTSSGARRNAASTGSSWWTATTGPCPSTGKGSAAAGSSPVSASPWPRCWTGVRPRRWRR